jgi:hypothetical protein
MVIHQENFVNLNYPDIHIQTVENLSMRAKRKKLRRQFGTSRNFLSRVEMKYHLNRNSILLYK